MMSRRGFRFGAGMLCRRRWIGGAAVDAASGCARNLQVGRSGAPTIGIPPEAFYYYITHKSVIHDDFQFI